MQFLRTLVVLGAVVAPTLGNALALTLDFEGGLLPSASGWGQSPNQPASVVTSIVPGAVPTKGGSNVLNMTGPENFGWFFDLDGLIDDTYSWSASVDFRQVANPNRNEVGNNTIGLVWNSPFGNAQANSTAPALGVWQTLEVRYDSVQDVFTAFVDGVSQTPSTAQGGLYPLSVQTSLSFGWGNATRFQSIDFDNLSFSATQVAPVPVPAGLPLLLGGLAALAAMRRARRDV